MDDCLVSADHRQTIFDKNDIRGSVVAYREIQYSVNSDLSCVPLWTSDSRHSLSPSDKLTPRNKATICHVNSYVPTHAICRTEPFLPWPIDQSIADLHPVTNIIFTLWRRGTSPLTLSYPLALSYFHIIHSHITFKAMISELQHLLDGGGRQN